MSHQFNNQLNPVTVDYRNAPREQRKEYSRMACTNGKTDRPRNIYSNAFRDGWERAFGKRRAI